MAKKNGIFEKLILCVRVISAYWAANPRCIVTTLCLRSVERGEKTNFGWEDFIFIAQSNRLSSAPVHKLRLWLRGIDEVVTRVVRLCEARVGMPPVDARDGHNVLAWLSAPRGLSFLRQPSGGGTEAGRGGKVALSPSNRLELYSTLDKWCGTLGNISTALKPAQSMEAVTGACTAGVRLEASAVGACALAVRDGWLVANEFPVGTDCGVSILELGVRHSARFTYDSEARMLTCCSSAAVDAMTFAEALKRGQFTTVGIDMHHSPAPQAPQARAGALIAQQQGSMLDGLMGGVPVVAPLLGRIARQSSMMDGLIGGTPVVAPTTAASLERMEQFIITHAMMREDGLVSVLGNSVDIDLRTGKACCAVPSIPCTRDDGVCVPVDGNPVAYMRLAVLLIVEDRGTPGKCGNGARRLHAVCDEARSGQIRDSGLVLADLLACCARGDVDPDLKYRCVRACLHNQRVVGACRARATHVLTSCACVQTRHVTESKVVRVCS